MTDIVTWLREQASNDFTCERKLLEAADEIERLIGERDRQYDYNCGQIIRIASLEGEIERMRAALMIIKSINENEEFPSVFVGDVVESALMEND